MSSFLIKIIDFYRQYSSLRARSRCRYFPTCSEYAKDSITEHGAARGILLATKRILRCNPFGSFGYDPVPEKQVLDV